MRHLRCNAGASLFWSLKDPEDVQELLHPPQEADAFKCAACWNVVEERQEEQDDDTFMEMF